MSLFSRRDSNCSARGSVAAEGSSWDKKKKQNSKTFSDACRKCLCKPRGFFSFCFSLFSQALLLEIVPSMIEIVTLLLEKTILRKILRSINFSHVGQTDQIDHKLDHLDPTLPF